MTTRTFFIIGGAIGVLYGIGFLLSPEMIGSIYGFKVSPSVILGYRYFGVALLSTGLLCWALKDLRDAVALRGIFMALAISDVAGILVSAWGTMNGIINSMGWGNVALYTALLLCCLYLLRDLSASARALPA